MPATLPVEREPLEGSVEARLIRADLDLDRICEHSLVLGGAHQHVSVLG